MRDENWKVLQGDLGWKCNENVNDNQGKWSTAEENCFIRLQKASLVEEKWSKYVCCPQKTLCNSVKPEEKNLRGTGTMERKKREEKKQSYILTHRSKQEK